MKVLIEVNLYIHSILWFYNVSNHPKTEGNAANAFSILEAKNMTNTRYGTNVGKFRGIRTYTGFRSKDLSLLYTVRQLNM